MLARRTMGQENEYAYYRAYGPERTSFADLVRLTATPSAMEHGLERAKDEVGLNQYEVRRWDAWHRHVTLCMLAHAALQVSKTRAKSDGRDPYPTQPLT